MPDLGNQTTRWIKRCLWAYAAALVLAVLACVFYVWIDGVLNQPTLQSRPGLYFPQPTTSFEWLRYALWSGLAFALLVAIRAFIPFVFVIVLVVTIQGVRARRQAKLPISELVAEYRGGVCWRYLAGQHGRCAMKPCSAG